ncbi:MAG TPA: ABC transporter substrate-binding protein [Stellaceae bacterium]|nr:ABC transporter substrate-binding protein [Stellaceae bacterium]
MKLAAAALVALILASGAARAEPVEIKVAWIVAPTDSPLAMLGKQGISRHEGTSYKLDYVHFTSTPAMITALASGDVDLAPLGFPALALAIENAHLDDLRVVTDWLEDGVGQSFSNPFFVLNDGPVKRIEDLKGRIVSSNAIGAAIDIGLRIMLRKHGLEDKRDYTLVESMFPTMKPELLEHKVDLVSVVPPFAFDPQLNAVGHALFTQKEAMGGPSQLLTTVARKPFIDKNRAALVDYFEDNLRQVRWYFDPKNHDEVIKIVTAYTKTPPSLWAGWAFTPKDSYRDPDGKPNLDALQRNIGTAHELGFIPAPLDPHHYADLSLVAEAAARLDK